VRPVSTCQRGNGGALTDMPFADSRKAVGGIQEAVATGANANVPWLSTGS
jgi:hypothetical protein